ncbi:hypothetical protein D1007_13898 [Hordeum vulgare]|nr:hypothetical protein D1007_13898 [Hordeum vulgare]
MASSDIIVAFVAVLCSVAVSGAGVTASPAPATAPSSISFFSETCESAGIDATVCIGPLSSDSAAPAPADTSRFARALVLKAKQDASATAAHLPRPYDSEDVEGKTFELQRCLQGCKKRYEAAVAYLGDAAAALDASKFDDAYLWLETVQAQVKLCHTGCQVVPPQWELIERNREVVRLCNVATTLTRMLQRH